MKDTLPEGFRFAVLEPRYDADIAALVRCSLKAHHLDIPGTAYYDEALDRLSAFYVRPGRAYFVLLRNGRAVGGAGLAECSLFEKACEMQKLYLDDSVKGRGLGYCLVRQVEEAAREIGFGSVYLETHTNLAAAIHIYEKSGYRQIRRPEGVVHSAMNRFFLKELR